MSGHPVALVCYNRPQHLARVLAGLRWLDVAKLYVFADGPKGPADRERVGAVREILAGVDWINLELFASPVNLGLAGNVVGAVDHVLARHETVILLEDDCVPGEGFYEFMCACLDRYRRVEDVVSVSGYAYRLPEGTFAGYPYHAFCFPRIETWGWATWRDRWGHYVRDAQLRRKLELAWGLEVDLTIGGADVPKLIRNKLERGLDIWSPGWLLGTALDGGLTVYPVRSHVQYIGADGSGANMSSSDRWASDRAGRGPFTLPDEPCCYGPAYKAMRDIFDSL